MRAVLNLAILLLVAGCDSVTNLEPRTITYRISAEGPATIDNLTWVESVVSKPVRGGSVTLPWETSVDYYVGQKIVSGYISDPDFGTTMTILVDDQIVSEAYYPPAEGLGLHLGAVAGLPAYRLTYGIKSWDPDLDLSFKINGWDPLEVFARDDSQEVLNLSGPYNATAPFDVYFRKGQGRASGGLSISHLAGDIVVFDVSGEGAYEANLAFDYDGR